MKNTERKALQEFMNKYGKVSKEQVDIFHELQVANKKETGHAWCSAKDNMEDLRKAGVTWAEARYERYVELNGQLQLLGEYGDMLLEIGFWKNK